MKNFLYLNGMGNSVIKNTHSHGCFFRELFSGCGATYKRRIIYIMYSLVYWCGGKCVYLYKYVCVCCIIILCVLICLCVLYYNFVCFVMFVCIVVQLMFVF